LEKAGIDTEALQRKGQLEVFPWEQAHLRPGYFDQEAMLGLLDETMAGHRTQGFPLTRLWSNQEWALRDVPGVSDIAEYEARYNALSARHEDLTVCVYDLTRFGADLVMDLLRTHPLVIISGMLYENPFFAQPDEFVAELRHRDDEVVPA